MEKRGTARAAIEIAGAVIVVLALAWLVFRTAVFEAPPAPPAAAVAQPARQQKADLRVPSEAVVVYVAGSVQSSVSGGAWQTVHVGQRLRADDALRTSKGGRTDLSVGDRSRLTLAESSQVTIRELTEKVHRFRLARGRIAVDYKPDGERVLRIEDESTDAVAETQAARFSVLSTGTSVAIATETGAVNLASRDGSVQVDGGKQSIVYAGTAPSAAETIPVKVLLKAANTAPSVADGLCANVEGVANPGSEVLVDGAQAQLSASGHFSVRVPRTRDRTSVLVALRDASGHEETRSIPCSPAELQPAQIHDFAIRWKRRQQP